MPPESIATVCDSAAGPTALMKVIGGLRSARYRSVTQTGDDIFVPYLQSEPQPTMLYSRFAPGRRACRPGAPYIGGNRSQPGGGCVATLQFD